MSQGGLHGLLPVLALVAWGPAWICLPSQEPGRLPADVLWRYESPQGFRLLEPAYRLPTPIKEGLVRFVQPVPELSRAYGSVFKDRQRFTPWFKGVLLARAKTLTEDGDTGPRVLSTDLSRLSPGKGVITSTTHVRTRVAQELEIIEECLRVMKVWESEGEPEPSAQTGKDQAKRPGGKRNLPATNDHR